MDAIGDGGGGFELSDIEIAILDPGMRRKPRPQPTSHYYNTATTTPRTFAHFSSSRAQAATASGGGLGANAAAAASYIAATAGAKATQSPSRPLAAGGSDIRSESDPFNPWLYAPKPAPSHSPRRTVSAVGDIVVFIVVAAASFLGSAILRQVTEIWPDNILVFVCAIEILIIAHYIIGGLHYVLQWHPNRDWVDGWTRVFNFIISALLLIPAYYVVTMIFNLFGHPAITAPQIFLVSTSAVTSGAFVAALLMHSHD